MANEEQKRLSAPKEQIGIRIQLKFKLHKNKLFKKQQSTNSVVQGMPIIAFLVVTNISNKAFKGAAITDAYFNYIRTDVNNSISHDIQIPALNPKGKIEIELDSLTFDMDGGCWGAFKLVPESPKQEIQCYQFDESHKRDEPYHEANSWGNSFYIEGKLASLQTKTNNYILALTIITVFEAVFGIKNVLLFLANILAITFSSLGDLFQYIAQFT